jgi:hypothetical protein
MTKLWQSYKAKPKGPIVVPFTQPAPPKLRKEESELYKDLWAWDEEEQKEKEVTLDHYEQYCKEDPISRHDNKEDNLGVYI